MSKRRLGTPAPPAASTDVNTFTAKRKRVNDPSTPDKKGGRASVTASPTKVAVTTVRDGLVNLSLPVAEFPDDSFIHPQALALFKEVKVKWVPTRADSVEP
jgi:hypothetical protein